MNFGAFFKPSDVTKLKIQRPQDPSLNFGAIFQPCDVITADFFLFSEGPLREVFNYKLTPDNTTVEMINLGKDMGGMRETTAEIIGESLVSYLRNPESGEIDMIATRTLDPSNPNVMYFKTKDVPYDYEMVATMKRQL